LAGGGPKPLSLKLSDSGHIPESITPVTILVSEYCLSTYCERPIKSQDLVVRGCLISLGKTDTTPSNPTSSILMVSKFMNIQEKFSIKKILHTPAIFLASLSVSSTTKPLKILV
jgi:hypothetical protein